MWRSRTFWRYLIAYWAFTLTSAVVLGLALAGRTHFFWISIIALGLIALMLAMWLARRIVLPVQELARAANRVGEGDYGHKVYVDSQDELGTLAESFNTMSTHLAEH